jgi:hypothetical protein
VAYPDELLDTAISLFRISPETQANLRRAVSSSYYALFHLLIGHACENWARPDQRARVARQLEHPRMKAVSKMCVGKLKARRPDQPSRTYLSSPKHFLNCRKSVMRLTTTSPEYSTRLK